jgi:methionyl-tRNA synthetase
MPLAECGLTAA